MNLLQQLINSKNFLTSLIFFGISQLNTLFTFFFSIFIPLDPITTFKNPISCTFHIYFFGFTYKSFFSNLLNTSFTILSCSFFASIPTNTLFINAVTFFLLIKSLRILFVIAQNVANKFVIPENITVSSKDLIYVVNTFFHSFSSLILTLLNSHHKFIFVNTFLFPMLSIKSVINGSG